MVIRVKVKPGSKVDEISREADGNIRIKIKAQPIEGKANKYLVEYLSEFFKLPKSKIEILKGETNSFKTISIDADDAYIHTALQRIA